MSLHGGKEPCLSLCPSSRLSKRKGLLTREARHSARSAWGACTAGLHVGGLCAHRSEDAPTVWGHGQKVAALGRSRPWAASVQWCALFLCIASIDDRWSAGVKSTPRGSSRNECSEQWAQWCVPATATVPARKGRARQKALPHFLYS